MLHPLPAPRHPLTSLYSLTEQGSIDLAAAYAASDVRHGLGLEIATPGRTWVFLADDHDTQARWKRRLTLILTLSTNTDAATTLIPIMPALLYCQC